MPWRSGRVRSKADSFDLQHKIEIIGIAVDEAACNQGIGSFMISELTEKFSLHLM